MHVGVLVSRSDKTFNYGARIILVERRRWLTLGAARGNARVGYGAAINLIIYNPVAVRS